MNNRKKGEVRFIRNKQKIIDILSSHTFVPAVAMPDAFIGMMGGNYVFINAIQLKEITDEIYQDLTQKTKVKEE